MIASLVGPSWMKWLNHLVLQEIAFLVASTEAPPGALVTFWHNLRWAMVCGWGPVARAGQLVWSNGWVPCLSVSFPSPSPLLPISFPPLSHLLAFYFPSPSSALQRRLIGGSQIIWKKDYVCELCLPNNYLGGVARPSQEKWMWFTTEFNNKPTLPENDSKP